MSTDSFNEKECYISNNSAYNPDVCVDLFKDVYGCSLVKLGLPLN
jgi:hypothetical protein